MDGRFFTNCVRNIIEKGASICVIIPQNRKVKKNSTSHYPSEFRAQQYGDKLTKKNSWKALKRKRRCTLHASSLWRLNNYLRASMGKDRLSHLALEECDFGHALGARTFYISPLRKCRQKTYKKTFWLLMYFSYSMLNE